MWSDTVATLNPYEATKEILARETSQTANNASSKKQ